MKSYSQAGQDLFAWQMSSEINNGTFLDLGCNHPTENNNTYALELLGWTGLCVDVLPFDYSGRKAKFVQHNAALMFPELDEFYMHSGGFVNYLSVDCDDATMEVLINVPFYQVKFGAISIEHDAYRLGPKLQERIHTLLLSFGYLVWKANVCAPEVPGMPWSGQPFEDFYYLP